MGMYDTVHIECPHCGKIHREQTKSGPCLLQDVALDDADPSMISGLSGDDGLIWCEHCYKPFRIETVTRPAYRAVKADDVDA